MPMATPMSAFLSAGASFTPSPVMATMWPFMPQQVHEVDLVLGGDAGDDADVVQLPRAPRRRTSPRNSAPVIARPRIPRSLAIASAVTAWSPVIMRTWMPALWASAIDTLAAGRGGSTMPTRASSVMPSSSGSMSALASKVFGSKSLRPVAMTRRPFDPRRSFSSR